MKKRRRGREERSEEGRKKASQTIRSL
jgi:hypothetical protein